MLRTDKSVRRFAGGRIQIWFTKRGDRAPFDTSLWWLALSALKTHSIRRPARGSSCEMLRGAETYRNLGHGEATASPLETERGERLWYG